MKSPFLKIVAEEMPPHEAGTYIFTGPLSDLPDVLIHAIQSHAETLEQGYQSWLKSLGEAPNVRKKVKESARSLDSVIAFIDPPLQWLLAAHTAMLMGDFQSAESRLHSVFADHSASPVILDLAHLTTIRRLWMDPREIREAAREEDRVKVLAFREKLRGHLDAVTWPHWFLVREAWHLRTEAHLFLGDLDEARQDIAHLVRMVEFKTSQPRKDSVFENGGLEKALATLISEKSIPTVDAPLLLYYGILRLYQGDPETVIQIFNQTSQILWDDLRAAHLVTEAGIAIAKKLNDRAYLAHIMAKLKPGFDRRPTHRGLQNLVRRLRQTMEDLSTGQRNERRIIVLPSASPTGRFPGGPSDKPPSPGAA